MTAHIKVGGTWKEFDPRVKVGGVWRNVDTGWVKVAGVWKQFYFSYIAISNLSYADTSISPYSNSEVIYPTVVGGNDPKTYSVTSGGYPPYVEFNSNTGQFTGPSSSFWPYFSTSSVSGNGNHTCTVTTSGGAKCWGWNVFGQLGNNSTSHSSTPVDVSGLTSGVASISSGYYHTCAITTSGGAKCWGRNNYGQLGNNSTTQSNVPVNVSGLTSGVSSISSGNSHTCAVTTSGGAKCWGWNAYGQLGNNSTTTSLIPVDVSGLTSGVASISSGYYHNCAVTTSGGAKCWGRNNYGQLGNNSTTQSNVPVNVSGLTSGVASISSGNDHTCAVTTSGGAKCWGWNFFGQLGNNSNTNSSVPVDVSGLTSGVASTSSGSGHTCAVTTSGGAKCWGYNINGQLGNNSTTQSNVPVNVSGLTSGVASTSSGNSHNCAVTTSGVVRCWGYNGFGQLKIYSIQSSLTSVNVYSIYSSGAFISNGSFHTCAVTTSGGAKCWGRNNNGQLGNNSNTNSSIPVDVYGLTSGVSSISGGQYHNCAVTTSGGAKCWGRNNYGQLGNNSTATSLVPVDVSGLTSGVASISNSVGHTCAVTTSGGAKCWGWNIYGQLGNNSIANSLVPVDVSGLTSGVSSISSGSNHTCAVTTSGGAKCWGYNASGQLGNNSTAPYLVPVDVSGLTSGVASISSGQYHTCAVTTSGGAKCWGRNNNGQLGNNSTSDSSVPVDVSGLTSGVASISSGSNHTCAVTTSGGAKCWGWNVYGQLGNNSTANSLVPVDVYGLTSGVSSISGGQYHTCAITTSGGAKCWGYNNQGQLGDSSINISLIPIDEESLPSHDMTITVSDGVSELSSNITLSFTYDTIYSNTSITVGSNSQILTPSYGGI